MNLRLVLVVLSACLLAAACSGEDAEETPTTTTVAPTTVAPTTIAPPTVAQTTLADSTTSTTLAPVSYQGGATYLTGRIADFTLDQGTVTTDADGVTHSRGGATTYTLISNDARVAGTVTSTWNTDRWGPGPANGAFVEWGEATLTNENGTWETSHSGIYATPLGDMNARWWVGSGDYTGLTFYMALPGETEPWEWVGLIYPGTPPPGA